MEKHTNSTISKLTDKIRNLNANFKRLESNAQVCKKVNDSLVKQTASLNVNVGETRCAPEGRV